MQLCVRSAAPMGAASTQEEPCRRRRRRSAVLPELHRANRRSVADELREWSLVLRYASGWSLERQFQPYLNRRSLRAVRQVAAVLSWQCHPILRGRLYTLKSPHDRTHYQLPAALYHWHHLSDRLSWHRSAYGDRVCLHSVAVGDYYAVCRLRCLFRQDESVLGR